MGVVLKKIDVSQEKISLQDLSPRTRHASFHQLKDDGGGVDDVDAGEEDF